jgi:hypothetical protein
MEQQPMTLNQMMQAYQQLTNDFNTRKIGRASYSAALGQLMAIDEEKRWWSCTPEGGFVWYDGKRWVPGQPSNLSAPDTNISKANTQQSPINSSTNRVQAAHSNTSSKGWQKLAATPILAILPGAVIGGIWFLYTLIQLILGKTGGVDILTPLILTGVPLVLWLLRKPLDKLLTPLQKFHKSFPYAIRLGIAFAVPLLTGCGCSAIFTSGYTAMHFTALMSTLFGYFLLRSPKVNGNS